MDNRESEEKRFTRDRDHVQKQYLRELRDAFYYSPFLFRKAAYRLRPRSASYHYAVFLVLGIIAAATATLLLWATLENPYVQIIAIVAYFLGMSWTTAQFGERIMPQNPYHIHVITKSNSWFSNRARAGVDSVLMRRKDFFIHHHTIDNDRDIDNQDHDLCNQLIRLSNGNDIDAVIIRPVFDRSDQFDAAIRSLLERGIFVVCIDVYIDLNRFRGEKNESPCLIYSDDDAGAKDIADLIAKRYVGKTSSVDIMVLGGPSRASPGRRRARALLWNLARSAPKLRVLLSELNSWHTADAVLAFQRGLSQLGLAAGTNDPQRELVIFCGTDMNAEAINGIIIRGEFKSPHGKISLIGYNGTHEDGEFKVRGCENVVATVDARPFFQGQLAADLIVTRSQTHKRLSRVAFEIPPNLENFRWRDD